MNTFDLETGFFNALKDVEFDGRTLAPDEVYDPKNGEAWRRGTVMLSAPNTVGFGDGVYSRLEGIYQIDIYVPRDEDSALKKVQASADLHLQSFFPANGRGRTVTRNETSAHITRRPNLMSFRREAAYLREIVEVEFYVDIPAVG